MKQLIEHIGRHGPVSYGRYIDEALYGADGFYSRGGGAGSRRDFATSPEVGALFGSVMAHALDSWWDELNQPDPFVVVEPGAGPGGLVASVLAAAPRCASSLRWLLVERSSAMRELQKQRRLPLVDASQIMGVVRGVPDEDDDTVFLPDQGPLVAQLVEMPFGADVHLIVANELLDNLAFDVAVLGESGWAEVRVGIDQRGGFIELAVPASDEFREYCERFAGEVLVGTRIPIQKEAVRWLGEALSSVARGRVVLVDYGATTAELATRPGGQWLRVYRDHRRSHDPMVAPGYSDITTDVAIDQLFAACPPTEVRTQADFLRAHGIDDIVVRAAAQAEREAAGSLAAIKLASFISERDMVLDPSGLGGFLVMEWVR